MTPQAAVAAIRLQGYAIFESLIARDIVDAARARVLELMDARASDKRSSGHVAFAPPFEAPFTEIDVIANPVVLEIAHTVLGDLRCFFWNINACLPGSAGQHAHVDYWNRLDDESTVVIPQLAVSVTLCDFTLENGATEMWPGTQHHPMTKKDAYTIAAPGGWIDQTAAQLPSVRVVGPAGTVVVRNACLWHRGMPNRTDQSREMLTVLYHPADTPFDRTGERNIESIPSAVWESLPAHVQTLFCEVPVGE